MTRKISVPYNEIQACRLCGCVELTPILSLGEQYLTGVFPREKNAAITHGPLEIVICGRCALVQLRHSYSLGEMYGENYGYRSGLNWTMVQHLSAKAALLAARAGLRRDGLVLDIGSNDGTLLKAYPVAGIRRVGMDPTGVAFSQYYSSDSELIPDFFCARRFLEYTGGRRADVVTSVAMFYDLENPLAFAQDVAGILDHEGIWHLEQSYLPTMLNVTAYDTICHEHLEYYRLRQIKWIADRAGLKILDVTLNSVNGGSFAVTVARKSSSHVEDTAAVDLMLEREEREGLSTIRPYSEFAARVLTHREKLLHLLGDLRDDRRSVYGYGASTKGNVLLQFCGLTEKEIPCITEVNTRKFGCYTPGTWIPIVSEEEARANSPDYFLVLPWHFRDSIVSREKQYLSAGGQLLFPLPDLECVSASTRSLETGAAADR